MKESGDLPWHSRARPKSSKVQMMRQVAFKIIEGGIRLHLGQKVSFQLQAPIERAQASSIGPSTSACFAAQFRLHSSSPPRYSEGRRGEGNSHGPHVVACPMFYRHPGSWMFSGCQVIASSSCICCSISCWGGLWDLGSNSAGLRVLEASTEARLQERPKALAVDVAQHQHRGPRMSGLGWQKHRK